VEFDGRFGNEQFAGNGFVGHARGQALEDVLNGYENRQFSSETR